MSRGWARADKTRAYPLLQPRPLSRTGALLEAPQLLELRGRQRLGLRRQRAAAWRAVGAARLQSPALRVAPHQQRHDLVRLRRRRARRAEDVHAQRLHDVALRAALAAERGHERHSEPL